MRKMRVQNLRIRDLVNYLKEDRSLELQLKTVMEYLDSQTMMMISIMITVIVNMIKSPKTVSLKIITRSSLALKIAVSLVVIYSTKEEILQSKIEKNSILNPYNSIITSRPSLTITKLIMVFQELRGKLRRIVSLDQDKERQLVWV